MLITPVVFLSSNNDSSSRYRVELDEVVADSSHGSRVGRCGAMAAAAKPRAVSPLRGWLAVAMIDRSGKQWY